MLLAPQKHECDISPRKDERSFGNPQKGSFLTPLFLFRRRLSQ